MHRQLEVFEEKYLALFFDLQRKQWENYETNAGHDLNVADIAIYKLLEEYRECEFPEGRKGKIAKDIVNRGLVDKHPKVASLRNRLDDWDNYLQDFSIEVLKDPHQKRLALAKAMEPDVLQLMLLRNQLSALQGYASYVHLVMATEELELERVQCMVEEYLHENLPQARILAIEYGLTWSSWFSQLEAVGVSYSSSQSFERAMTHLCEELGLSEAVRGVRLFEQGPLAGYVGAIDVPNDVRIMVKGAPSPTSLRTLFHELGHALSHRLNKAEGLCKTWTAVSDETMAVIIEKLGIELLFDGEERQFLKDMTLLENVRVSLSFLFEMDLWQNPRQAKELYSKYYIQLGLSSVQPELWCLDSFRSIDSVYIHNYILSAHFAEQVHIYVSSVFKDDLKAGGTWLREKLYGPGRSVSLERKIYGALEQ